MQNIIVIFEANDERLEGLALAFGLGAVQKKANIRLRHLNPSADVHLAHQSYGSLQLADLVWAEGIGIFLEPNAHRGLEVLTPVLQAFSEQDQPKHRGAYLFSENPGDEAIQTVAKLLPAGVTRLEDEAQSWAPTAEYLTLMGQRLATMQVE